MLTQLAASDISAKEPVQWPVYSRSGRLLLLPGQSFPSEQLIEILLWRGLFRGNKNTTDSVVYEKYVDVKEIIAATKYPEKARQNYNKEFAALEKNKADSAQLFQKMNESEQSGVVDHELEETNNNSDKTEKINSKVGALAPENNSQALSEEQFQYLISNVKESVSSFFRSELETVIKESIQEQLKAVIGNEIFKTIQNNVVSDIGDKLDFKIKSQVSRSIGCIYGQEKRNPINRLINISRHLELVYAGLQESVPESASGILEIAADIQEICREYPDAMLMSIHLYNEGSYTIRHPIDMAILCELLSLRQGITNKTHRQYIVAAALTCDFSMRDLQRKLQSQTADLSQDQQDEIKLHSVRCIALLLSIDVMEPIWLDTVAQHHERIDGSGYPLQYTEDQICQGAKILAVCDRYCAMVTRRQYRDALHGKEALGVFLAEDEKHYDKNIMIMLINELSVYPPGTFVQLANGEYAVVTHRDVNQISESKIQPTVLSFSNADGKGISPPTIRKCHQIKYRVRRAISWDKAFLLSAEDIWELSEEKDA